jgi:hypothetical protein
MYIGSLTQPANLGVEIPTKQHIRGYLGSTSNLIQQGGKGVSDSLHRKMWADGVYIYSTKHHIL